MVLVFVVVVLCTRYDLLGLLFDFRPNSGRASECYIYYHKSAYCAPGMFWCGVSAIDDST